MYPLVYDSEKNSQQKKTRAKNFSYVIPLSVLKSNIPTPAKLFYGFLTRITRSRDGCTWTNDQISERFRVCNRTVDRWIADLRSAGLITTDLTPTPTGGFVRNIQIVSENRSTQYISIPESVALSPLLTDGEKVTYGAVVQLTKKTGECWATNSYIAGLLNASPESVLPWIRKLEHVDLISADRGLNDRKIWINDLEKFLSRHTDPLPPIPPRQKRPKGDGIKSTPPRNAHISILKNKKNNSASARESNSVVFSSEEFNESQETAQSTPKKPKLPREILPCLQQIPPEYRITDAAKRWIGYKFSPKCVENGVRYLLTRDPLLITNTLAYLTAAILGNYQIPPLTDRQQIIELLVQITAVDYPIEKIREQCPQYNAYTKRHLPELHKMDTPPNVIFVVDFNGDWIQATTTVRAVDEYTQYLQNLCHKCGYRFVQDDQSISVFDKNGVLLGDIKQLNTRELRRKHNAEQQQFATNSEIDFFVDLFVDEHRERLGETLSKKLKLLLQIVSTRPEMACRIYGGWMGKGGDIPVYSIGRGDHVISVFDITETTVDKYIRSAIQRQMGEILQIRGVKKIILDHRVLRVA